VYAQCLPQSVLSPHVRARSRYVVCAATSPANCAGTRRSWRADAPLSLPCAALRLARAQVGLLLVVCCLLFAVVVDVHFVSGRARRYPQQASSIANNDDEDEDDNDANNCTSPTPTSADDDDADRDVEDDGDGSELIEHTRAELGVPVRRSAVITLSCVCVLTFVLDR
jgi:hypothetical protein